MSGISTLRIVGIDGQQLQEFICCICLNVLSDPIVTDCCQQMFCRQCITRWLSDHNSCPNDRKVLKTSHLMSAPKAVKNLLNNMDVKCGNYEKGCQAVIKMDQLDKHLEECQYKSENESNKDIKIQEVIYDPKTNGSAVEYDFRLKFGIRQTLRSGRKTDAVFVGDRDHNVFMALFDEKDIDFEITVENQSRHNIKFGVTIVGNDVKEHSFILQKEVKSSLKALENEGKHLHFVSQDTDEGKLLVAMNAQRSGVSYAEASVNCSRISFTVDIEKTDEEIEYERRRKEYERQQRIIAAKRRMIELQKKPNQSIDVEVITLTGKTIVIKTSIFDIIAQVKEFIQAKEGIPPDQQILVFGKQQLFDEITLYDYGIKNESVLNLIVRLRGGGSGERQLLSKREQVGERGVVCFGEKTDQKFDWYSLPPILGPSILGKFDSGDTFVLHRFLLWDSNVKLPRFW